MNFDLELKETLIATAAGAGNPVDTNNSGKQARQVFMSVSANIDATVVLEEADAVDGTWTPLGDVTLAAAGQGSLVATPSKRYVRSNVTAMGTGTAVAHVSLFNHYHRK